jgi:hypothetical protein
LVIYKIHIKLCVDDSVGAAVAAIQTERECVSCVRVCVCVWVRECVYVCVSGQADYQFPAVTI